VSQADEPDHELFGQAHEFAAEIAELLDRTVTSSAPVAARVRGHSVVVAAYNEYDDLTAVPLKINGEHRLDLRIEYWCRWGFTAQFLRVQESNFALMVAGLGEPLVRFEYVYERPVAPAHIQVHGESSALGYLLSWKSLTRPPKLQELHLPVGGRRFRPCLEDVVEFAIGDLGLDAQDDWQQRIEEGRRGWRKIQLAAAMRDLIRDAPEEMRDTIKAWADDAYEAVQTGGA
jgi:hypothetical protein